MQDLHRLQASDVLGMGIQWRVPARELETVMTDWDRLIEETSKIHRDNMRDAYERGYMWGLVEGKRLGNEEMLQWMKEKMEWKS